MILVLISRSHSALTFCTTCFVEVHGRREGGIPPERAAETDSARKSRIFRSCAFKKETKVNKRDTNSLPAAESEPKLVLRCLVEIVGRGNLRIFRRQVTAGRMDFSAALLVGSTSSTRTNSHKAVSSLSKLRHVRTVLARGVFSVSPIRSHLLLLSVVAAGRNRSNRLRHY
jgi:hypothetical protein